MTKHGDFQLEQRKITSESTYNLSCKIDNLHITVGLLVAPGYSSARIFDLRKREPRRRRHFVFWQVHSRCLHCMPRQKTTKRNRRPQRREAESKTSSRGLFQERVRTRGLFQLSIWSFHTCLAEEAQLQRRHVFNAIMNHGDEWLPCACCPSETCPTKVTTKQNLHNIL